MINFELLNRIEEAEAELIELRGSNRSDNHANSWEADKKELEQRIKDLVLASEFASREASETRIKSEETESSLAEVERRLETSLKDLEESKSRALTAEGLADKLKKDLELQKERAEEEYEVGMKTKREQLKAAEKQVEEVQKRLDTEQEMKQEMIETAQQLQVVYEKKLGDAQHRQFQQDTALRELEDKLAEAGRKLQQVESAAAGAKGDSKEQKKEAETAAEIENEDLRAQVEHQTKKIASLEDQIEELQVQSEKETEVLLKTQEKHLINEKKHKEEVALFKTDVKTLREQVTKGKERIEELEMALRDQGRTLAGAQGEVEARREELAVSAWFYIDIGNCTIGLTKIPLFLYSQELENLRLGQGALASIQKERDGLKVKVAELERELKEAEGKLSVASVKSADVDAKDDEILKEVGLQRSFCVRRQ